MTKHRMTPTAAGRTSNIYDLVLDHDDLLGSAVLLEGSRDVTKPATVNTQRPRRPRSPFSARGLIALAGGLRFFAELNGEMESIGRLCVFC